MTVKTEFRLTFYVKRVFNITMIFYLQKSCFDILFRLYMSCLNDTFKSYHMDTTDTRD